LIEIFMDRTISPPCMTKRGIIQEVDKNRSQTALHYRINLASLGCTSCGFGL
jgi:hypothetical protein